MKYPMRSLLPTDVIIGDVFVGISFRVALFSRPEVDLDPHMVCTTGREVTNSFKHLK